MLRWRRSTVACCAALAAATARAEESVLSSLFGADAPLASGRPSAFVLFSGDEADRASSYASAGFKVRPFRPLGEDRFVLLASAGHGYWRETGPLRLGRASDSEKFGASLLAGTEWSLAGGALGLFAGPEFFSERLVDPVGAVIRKERRWGLRVQADWWSNPTPETMLAVNVAAGTARRDVWSRVAWGWRIGPATSRWGFAGPEAAFSAAPHDWKIRLGAHWSEWGVFGFRFRLSGGYSQENGRPSVYLTFGGYRVF